MHVCFLDSLDLSRNLLTGSLPSSLRSRLTRLSSFRLSHNFLNGKVHGVDDAKKSKLDLSSNFLTGTSPEEIWILNSLEILNFSSNVLMSNFPNGTSPGNHLATLDLAENSWTGSTPLDFGNLSNLTSLGLSTNYPNILTLQNTWELLLSMAKLESLDLSGNAIEFFPTQLNNLTNLEDLNLSYN